jgi:hypothetical protein
MASVSSYQSGTVTMSAEFGHLPRTPASQRSWRHWSLRSSAPESPIMVSEGRYYFFGTLRGRGSSQNHSASENGSPTKLDRRKSIADLFDGMHSPKKHKERTWSLSGKTTRSRSTSPAKKNAITGKSRRFKKVTNIH